MGFFKKKADPIGDRSKALNAQIAALEAQIKRLDLKLQQGATTPRSRTPMPPSNQPGARAARDSGRVRDPGLELVDQGHRKGVPDAASTRDHYNDLGVRKYDLAGAWRRLRSHFRGPPVSNPRLVTYLAAGSIKGLRPLRYEKRVARNRFIVLFIVLVCLLWGIIVVFTKP